MTEAATEKTGPKCIREEVLNGPKNNIDIYIYNILIIYDYK